MVNTFLEFFVLHTNEIFTSFTNIFIKTKGHSILKQKKQEKRKGSSWYRNRNIKYEDS